MPTESPRRARQREIEDWIARVRLGAVYATIRRPRRRESVPQRGSVFRLELPAG